MPEWEAKPFVGAVVDLSLFQATLLFGFVLLLAGASLLLKYTSVSAVARSFPRSKNAGYLLMGLAMAWTLWRVTQLGPADYGDFKRYIFIGFLVLGGLAFKYAPDFLSVRALTILYLLAADRLLDAAWMRYEESLRLFLVAAVYVGIALAIYLAYAPYRMRDFFSWLFAVDSRAKRFAVFLAAFGLVISGVAFAY